MSANQNYIIFHSTQCEYSKLFLTELYKNIELYRKFVKVDVGKSNVRIPPQIKSIPTIIVPIQNKKVVLTGDDAFEWLANVNRKSNDTNNVGGTCNNGDIMSYDPIGMSGFSDGFSYYDKDNINNDVPAMDKSFMFLGDNINNNMITLPDDNELDGDSLKKEQAGRALEELKAARDREIPPAPTRQ